MQKGDRVEPTKGAGLFERPGNVRGAISRARHLRREMTASEKSLWEALRALKLHIRRQVPMGRYIADFAHHPSGLVIEVDSARHDLPEEQRHDAERDAYGNPFVVADRVRREIQNAVSSGEAAKPLPETSGIHPQPCPSPIEGEGFGDPSIQTGGK